MTTIETFDAVLTLEQMKTLAGIPAPTYKEQLERALMEMDGEPPEPTGWQILATIFDTLNREGGPCNYGWELDRWATQGRRHMIMLTNQDAYFHVGVDSSWNRQGSYYGNEGVLQRLCQHIGIDAKEFCLLASTLHAPPNPAIAALPTIPRDRGDAAIWLPSRRHYLSTNFGKTYTLPEFQEIEGQTVIAWR